MGKRKDTANRSNIVQSLDFQYGARSTVGMVVTFLLCNVCFFFRYGRQDMTLSLIVTGIIILPPTIWNAIRWLGIFRHPEAYVFFRTKLDQPNLVYRRGVYYTVRGTDPDGNPIVANTRRMFGNLFHPTMEEYNNLQVLAGYNRRTRRLIIVRKAIYD